MRAGPVLARAVIHDDLGAKVRVAQALNYHSEVSLSLVYRTAYLVRDHALISLMPDFPPPNDGDHPE